MWWNGAGKGVSSTEAVGNVHALLPALQLSTVELLEATILLQILILIVVIIEIKLAHLKEAARKLAPSALPLRITSLAASPPQTLTSSNIVAPNFARMGASNVSRPRRRRHIMVLLWPIVCKLEQMSTLHAVPVAIRNVVESDTMCMVGSIAAVTQEQDIFSFGRVANGAWVALFLIFLGYILAQPGLDVELGHLFLVLNIVCRNCGACVEKDKERVTMLAMSSSVQIVCGLGAGRVSG